MNNKATRTSEWAFESALISAPMSDVKGHPAYADAKAGDVAAAARLVCDTFDVFAVQESLKAIDSWPVVAAVHAMESAGINVIPEGMAIYLSECLGLELEASLVQTCQDEAKTWGT